MDQDRIVGAAKSFAGKAERTIGEVAGDRSAQMRGATTDVEGAIQNAYGQAKDAARGAADAAAGAANQAYEAGSAAVRQGADMVAERPGSALLTAGLIGFALGIIIARGSRPAQRSHWRRYYDA